MEANILATLIKEEVVNENNELPWEGTASDLLKELNNKATEQQRRSKSWPKDGSWLSNKLHRLAPHLKGIAIDFSRGGSKRTILVGTSEQVKERKAERETEERAEKSKTNTNDLAAEEVPF